MELTKLKTALQDNIEAVLKKLNIEYEIYGDNIYAKCPIHSESDNPRAFSYSISRGIWKCWTRDCQQEHKNDVFGLISGTLANATGKEIVFKDTLKWSYSLLGIKNTHKNKKTIVVPIEDNGNEEDFFNIISALAINVEPSIDKEINFNTSTKCPSEYFMSRGFKASTLKHFHVGDALENGPMKNRAIIPIHNDDGNKLVGVIGRSTKEYQMPKFLLYPKGFDKKNYFYNYHRAYNKAIETSCMYILEGQGDVWKLYESGVQNAISIFGKTISEQQITKLNKLPITHLIIIMDNDQAGRESRMQIQRQLGRMYKLTFPKLSCKDVGEMKVTQIKKEILSHLQGTY